MTNGGKKKCDSMEAVRKGACATPKSNAEYSCTDEKNCVPVVITHPLNR